MSECAVWGEFITPTKQTAASKWAGHAPTQHGMQNSERRQLPQLHHPPASALVLICFPTQTARDAAQPSSYPQHANMTSLLHDHTASRAPTGGRTARAMLHTPPPSRGRPTRSVADGQHCLAQRTQFHADSRETNTSYQTHHTAHSDMLATRYSPSHFD